MVRATSSELIRFNEKWSKQGDCHIWTANKDKDGYGIFFFRKFGRRAHRVAYYIFVGDIPDGLVIDHICGKRGCVNPAHLRTATVRENSLSGRGIGAINAQRTHCKFGHKFDKKWGKQRYCSTCHKEKLARLRAKWAVEDTIKC